MIWKIGKNRSLDLSRRGQVMGIVNVTPDSFSDGGQFFDQETAVDHAIALLDEGAEILDIGGESTRPGADSVGETEEMARVLPVIQGVIERRPRTVISIDTMKASVARVAIEAGASIVNDVTGLDGDPEMLPLVAESGVGVVIMHMQGTPRTMQQSPTYENVVEDVKRYFARQYERAVAAGVEESAIVFDPGIGFGKTLDHNLTLLRELGSLDVANRPILLGVSRKSFIGKIVGSENVADRDWPTVALTSFAREQGVRLVRVHGVRSNVEAMRMTEAILHVDGNA